MKAGCSKSKSVRLSGNFYWWSLSLLAVLYSGVPIVLQAFLLGLVAQFTEIPALSHVPFFQVVSAVLGVAAMNWLAIMVVMHVRHKKGRGVLPIGEDGLDGYVTLPRRS